jgi:hypothetical protein
MGIEELKDVVFSGLKIGEALSDGIQVTDVAALVSLPEAISGISDVPAEIADLDEAEAEELKRFVKDNFDIPDDSIEEFVEKAVAFVVQAYGLFLAFKDIKTEGGGE